MTLYSLEQNVVERIAYFQKLCEGTVVWSLFQCSLALASREAQWLQGVAQGPAEPFATAEDLQPVGI